MAANVETMFSVRTKPWHDIGTIVMDAPDSEHALELAGLNWQVVQKDVYTDDGEWYHVDVTWEDPVGSGKNDNERLEIVIRTMEDGGISPAEDFLERYPHELSGGQLQRISILRSMMLQPAFMVADEPVSMLDVSIRADIINMLLKLVRDMDTALVFISHDIATTRYISDRVAVMYLGRIVEEGRTDEVLHDPRHPYTKVLISNCGSIDPLEKREVIKIEGEPPTPIDTGPGSPRPISIIRSRRSKKLSVSSWKAA